MKNYLRFIFLFFFLISVDQVFKLYFSAVSICNENIAWSVLVSPGVFYFIWVVIIVILIYAFLNAKSTGQKYFLILIFSGAVSNIIDRLSHGCVVDFIDLKIWPVFNLADLYITSGIILLIIFDLCLRRS